MHHSQRRACAALRLKTCGYQQTWLSNRGSPLASFIPAEAHTVRASLRRQYTCQSYIHVSWPLRTVPRCSGLMAFQKIIKKKKNFWKPVACWEPRQQPQQHHSTSQISTVGYLQIVLLRVASFVYLIWNNSTHRSYSWLPSSSSQTPCSRVDLNSRPNYGNSRVFPTRPTGLEQKSRTIQIDVVKTVKKNAYCAYYSALWTVRVGFVRVGGEPFYPSNVNAGKMLHLFDLFRVLIIVGVRPMGAYPVGRSPSRRQSVCRVWPVVSLYQYVHRQHSHLNR